MMVNPFFEPVGLESDVGAVADQKYLVRIAISLDIKCNENLPFCMDF